jgi:hypothetical protein
VLRVGVQTIALFQGKVMQRQFAIILAAAVMLGGCSSPWWDSYNHVTRAVPPRASGPDPRIAYALACIGQSRTLGATKIAVAIHADGTGKYNHIADGATGNYLPQGTTATFASDAVLRAGARAFNYYELNTERAMRAFATADEQKTLADMQDATLPNYVLSTSFTALDFIGGPDVDVQIGGVGPYWSGRGASVEAVAEIYQPGSRAILKMSSIQRYVNFAEGGATIAKLIGTQLVTGGALYADQQRLQEATRDVVALSVADVLSQFHRVPKLCRGEVQALLDGQAWKDDPALPPQPVALQSRG